VHDGKNMQGLNTTGREEVGGSTEQLSNSRARAPTMEREATKAVEQDGSDADAAMDCYAREGDPKAFSRLIDLLQPRLFAYLRRQLRDAAAAEDLVQVCFLKLHQHRGQFCPGAAVLPYVFAIARRLLIDKIRSDRRARGREDELVQWISSHSAEPEETVAQRRLLSRLERALQEIPASHREAFELVSIDGLSLEDAAAIVDTTPGALKMRTHYARAALRARLGHEIEEILR
jgi:RNA polymerase sigma-70 factor (ECF subfamily)